MSSRLGRVLSALVAPLLTGLLVGPALAQTQSPTTTTPPTTTLPTAQASTIEQQLRDAYDDASAAEAVTLDAYRTSLQKAAVIDAQIVEIDAASATVRGFLAAAQEKAAAAQRDLASGEERRASIQKELEIERGRLERRAIVAYVGGDARQAQLEALLSAADLRDLESVRAYSNAIVSDQLETVTRVRQLEVDARKVRDQLAEAEAQIRGQRDAIATYEAQLVAKRAEAEVLRVAQAAETARQNELLADIRSRKRAYLDRLRALQRESDGISQLLRTTQRTQKLVLELPKLRTPLEKPIRSESGFGQRVHPIFQEVRMHTGIDLGGTPGQPIRAAAAGTVILATTQEGYGNVIVIDHGNQLATLYSHLNSLVVKTGDTVVRGQVIGGVGATGYATGPHLHFEYRVSGSPVDPLPHIDFDEPLPGSCEALARSTDPADQAAFRARPECATTTTTVGPPASVPPGGSTSTTTR